MRASRSLVHRNLFQSRWYRYPLLLIIEIYVELVAASVAAVEVGVVWGLRVVVTDSVDDVASAPIRFRYIRHIIYLINFILLVFGIFSDAFKSVTLICGL